MKIKYLRLTKEEKKQVQNDFYNTELGKEFKKYINISIIMNILLIIIGIYYILDTVIKKGNVGYYYFSSVLIIIAIIFLFFIYKAKVKKYNDFVIKKSRK